ncbi:hypothetical protein CYMTET_30061 [Cymbomonas tetramitiformis]|uniref:Uncharacterized protein n=1 Tax=Cymbomonas tetramitiformis TaxID=36881 RepID=A0AAE0FK78_9CHLO|nr:hypothetical protein CYMTET_30061 [Cymbomonas tetramitiformis]
MAWSNFFMTALGVGTVAYLMRSDVRHTSVMLRRNIKTIRGWLDSEAAASSKSVKPEEAKQIAQPPKDPPSPQK